MKIMKLVLTSLFICSLTGLMAQGLGIIPEPYLSTKGKDIYTLPKTITISAPTSLKTLIDPISNQLKLVTGKNVNFSKTEPTIEFSLIKDDVIGNEGYLLNVNPQGIQIKANTEAGLFYGWQSLQQIMPAAIYGKSAAKNINWQVPHCSIIDKPRFGWRKLFNISQPFFGTRSINKRDIFIIKTTQ